MFMGARVDTDWKPGHPITMSGEFNGKSFRDSGEIRSHEPLRELSFTHFSGAADSPQQANRGNLVTIRLRAEGAATRVVLTQEPLGDQNFSDAQRVQFEKNWSAMLQALKSRAEAASARA